MSWKGCERRVDVLEESTACLGKNAVSSRAKVPSDSLGRLRVLRQSSWSSPKAPIWSSSIQILGIEPTTSKGPQYVHWYELALCFSRGHSLLIYQHFGRQKHDQFVESQAEALARLGNADRVFAFYDDAVAFLSRSPTRSHGKPRSSEGEGRGQTAQMARIAGQDTSVRGPATPPRGRLGLHAAGRTVLLLHDRIPFHQGFGFCAVVGGYGYGGVVVAPV